MTQPSSIHTTLARSYLVYFICSIVGLFADTVIGLDFAIVYRYQIAISFFVIGSFLILWAQYTSRHLARQTEGDTAPYFFRGPYRYMRNPTHLGILILVTGYAIVSGSLIFFGITLVGYFVSNKFFYRYEHTLDQTYGDEHVAYKAKVPKIF